jgi:hypothetical protein
MVECNNSILDVVISGCEYIFQFFFQGRVQQLEVLLCLFVCLLFKSGGELGPSMDEWVKWSLENESFQSWGDAFSEC